MAERTTALIIPFPNRSTPLRATAQDAVALSSDQLSAALSSLSSALAEQRVAFDRWRDAGGCRGPTFSQSINPDGPG